MAKQANPVHDSRNWWYRFTVWFGGSKWEPPNHVNGLNDGPPPSHIPRAMQVGLGLTGKNTIGWPPTADTQVSIPFAQRQRMTTIVVAPRVSDDGMTIPSTYVGNEVQSPT